MEHNYTQKSEEQKRFYNETAQHYDRWHTETPSSKIVDQWNFENLQASIGNKKVQRCIELGTGTGRLANSLFQIAEEVYGIDISEKVLEIARQKYPALMLQQAEAVSLPYENNFFDLVVINGSLHHFFAMEKTFAEVFRVLKPGGTLALLGEPNKVYFYWYNPFFYIWVFSRITSRVLSFLHIISPHHAVAEKIEPDIETFLPHVMRKALQTQGFTITDFYSYDYFGRTDAKWFLLFYRKLLSFEHKTLARIIPGCGMILQTFAKKPGGEEVIS